MPTRKPAGGTGSNQYATKGASRRTLTEAEMRSRLETEQVAAAFAESSSVEGAGGKQMTRARRLKHFDGQIGPAFDPNPKVRAALAKNPDCQPILLEHLVKDPYGAVWLPAWLALHDPTEIEAAGIKKNHPERQAASAGSAVWVQQRLAKDPDPSVRRTLAESVHTDLGVLATMTEDPESRVLVGIVKNPNCTSDIFAAVPADHADIRWARADSRLCSPEELAGYLQNRGVASVAARNPNCTPRMLAEAYGDHPDHVREAIARNPSCPREVMERILDAGTHNTQVGLINNPNCPTEFLERLANDGVDIHVVSIARARLLERLRPTSVQAGES